MKKILLASGATFALAAMLAAPVFAENTQAENTTAKPTPNTDAIACVRTAITKRETSIQNAFSAYTTAQNTALTTRSSALSAAYAVADAKTIRKSLKDAWTTYRKTHSAITKSHNESVKAAWSLFSKDVKTCKTTGTIPVDARGQNDDHE